MNNTAQPKSKVLDRQTKQKEVLIGHLQKVPIVQAVCDKIGISRMTFYRWKAKDKVFKEKVEDALLQGCDLISDLAESQIINLIKNQNLNACTFWLKSHAQQYRDKLEVTTKRHDDELTPEEEKNVARALNLAKLACNPKKHGSKKDS